MTRVCGCGCGRSFDVIPSEFGSHTKKYFSYGCSLKMKAAKDKAYKDRKAKKAKEAAA